MNKVSRVNLLSIIEKLFVHEVIRLKRIGDSEVSVIIPVFNQEDVIEGVIKSIANTSGMNIEILVLDDHSQDSTCELARRCLEEIFNTHQNIKQVTLGRCRVQLFEVLCDSLLIASSESPIVVDVQADITILEPNFDFKIWNCFDKYPELSLLSGRGIERISAVNSYLSGLGAEISLGRNLRSHFFYLFFNMIGQRDLGKKIRHKIDHRRFLNKRNRNTLDKIKVKQNFDPYPNKSQFKSIGRAGRLGNLVDKEFDDLEIRETLYIGERFKSVVMRGPLAFRKIAFNEVGGLDYLSFYQGFDDCDLSLRLHRNGKWTIGYLPIVFSAPISRGSMRKKKTRMDLLFATCHLCRIQLFRRTSVLFKFLQSDSRFVEKG